MSPVCTPAGRRENERPFTIRQETLCKGLLKGEGKKGASVDGMRQGAGGVGRWLPGRLLTRRRLVAEGVR